jgi:hypothetical protein
MLAVELLDNERPNQKKPSEEGFIRGRFGFISVPDFLNLFINRTINHGDIPQHKS